VSVAELANNEGEALMGFRPISADWLRSRWTAPSADRENDSAIVEFRGAVCAWLSLSADPPFTEVSAAGGVATAYHGRGLGGALVDDSERRARRFVKLAPVDSRVVMYHSAYANEPRVSRLLSAHGYDQVRLFELMRIDFADDLPPPVWPPDIDVRALREEDTAELYAAHREAFLDHWGAGEETEEDFRHYELGSPRFDPSLWLVAWSGGEAVGYVGADAESDEDSMRGYVNLLGVRRAYRKRGLGEALLRQAFCELRARGKRGCDLYVDAESPTGATRLYERLGMTRYPRFATWEKELRPAGDV
jgi:mycothiol synthase